MKELAKQARQRKQLLQRRRAAKAQERAEKLARGEELDPNETDEYCPEVRVADAREAREQREQQEEARQKGRRGGPGDNMFQDQIMGERRLLKEDGTPVQMNTAKWPFAIEDDGATIIVDVALPKFLDSAQASVPRRPAKRCDHDHSCQHLPIAVMSAALVCSAQGQQLVPMRTERWGTELG